MRVVRCVWGERRFGGGGENEERADGLVVVNRLERPICREIVGLQGK